ncbi:Ppx/GppA phosphatase family protein [Lysinibacter cavernae]|uniref:Exopolyphosphatase/guanosine-5'-triphosphate, 3'-diphosphate pyrophosphatase n=1 Tax=Lysinibacter cavernae TaxID=1640652 RepID=A0A7X5R0I6_9MICO|nr:Ppx/GppA phosphatase family protein [Lysinibacter cavernae]NIH53180.1 exopolyphosphatase/guanosine-5'-triphosphate,3'-diphosphate pyrophosphatase [Lysinibacter cavernae]
MRLGVLDVGSNTVHLLVVDAHPGAGPVPTTSHKSVLRLMRYITPDGSISDEGVDALVNAVQSAADIAASHNLDALLPMATSAVREATNGEATLRRIHEETGVDLQVLSGEEEARLTFLAIRRWYGWSAGNILVFDIGGGSLEITQGSDEYPDVAVSLPLGAGRSTISFLHNDPPTEEQVINLAEHANRVITEASVLFEGQPKPDHIVGSSKTIRSLGKLAGSSSDGVGKRARNKLSVKKLSNWLPRLAQIPAHARPALPGITEDRAFQITAGGIVLREAMTVMGAEKLEVSPWALREGVIMRYLDQLD